MNKMVREIHGKTYVYSGKYSWTRTKAKKRKKELEKRGFDIKIIPLRTTVKKRTACALFAHARKKRGVFVGVKRKGM